MSGGARLAWRRAGMVVASLIDRGIPALRLAATAPGRTGGLQPRGLLTIHPLPDASTRYYGGEGAAYEGARSVGLVPYGGGGSEAPAEYDGHRELLLARLDAQLATAQHEFAALQERANESLAPLPAPVRLLVDVHQVSVSGAAVPPSSAGLDGADARVFLVFGSVRVASYSAEFEVHDLVVDDLDIELWEGSGARLLGHTCLSVFSLLNRDQVAIDAALPLTASGGLVVGTVRIHIEREFA
mmetsp:Transcript_30593/g.79657  ORF Transcript_30593/g.79657 Transcript_30593/m.79657 type:complete len:242 (-) Transcript_30593:411-1136(-)